MKALSILQPWAWLITRGHKDIENRGWYTPYRGRFLVHASKAYPKREYIADLEYFSEDYQIILPPYEQFGLGGIVGEATLIDCAKDSPSRWYNDGSWAFVLAGMKPWPFMQCRGQLGWWDFPIPPEFAEQRPDLINSSSTRGVQK